MLIFFYIPWLSRWIGRPTYHWVARNRMLLSKYIFSAKSCVDGETTVCGAQPSPSVPQNKN